MAPPKKIKKAKFKKAKKIKPTVVPQEHRYAHLEKYKQKRHAKAFAQLRYNSPSNSYSQHELTCHLTIFDNFTPVQAIVGPPAEPAKNAYSFAFDTDFNYLFNNTSDVLPGTQNIRTRVKCFKVFAFPEVVRGQDINENLYKLSSFQYGMFAAMPANVGSDSFGNSFVSQQVTTIQPSATPEWQCILDVDCEKTLDFSNILPAVIGETKQHLFVLSAFDLLSGNPLAETVPVGSISLPLRVEVTFYHPVRLATNAGIQAQFMENANTNVSVLANARKFAIPSISKVSNVL
jgi:hypothetical protein